MHPRTREILDFLDGSHLALADAVGEVPEPLRERRPSPDRWSVAEVVEHMARVEDRIAGFLAEPLARAAAGAVGPEGETSPVAPTFDVAALLDRSRPLVAGATSQPDEGLPLGVARARLDARREELRRAVAAADGRALGEMRLPHPRFGELDLYQWLLFVGGHEQRHAAQVREIGAALRDGGAGAA
jgi:hypothetical protein